ncbi:MAG: adenylyl-sulfate kinase [Candidatus Krumholzibacteriia bacterium]
MNAQPVHPRSEIKSKNIVWSDSEISYEDRITRNGHKGAVLWFTGLSGAGKSTLARLVEKELFLRRCHTYILDGDNVRHGLNRDLGFSPEDRNENIRRIGEVARLFLDAGSICITAFISPYRSDRQRARDIMPPGAFIEIYCRCPLDICEQRDPKGLYRRARAGEIPEFTGISAPYEEPEDPEIVVETAGVSPVICVDRILAGLQDRRILYLNGR